MKNRNTAPVVIWDWQTRLFHWSLLIAVSTCAYTGWTGGFTEMDVHMMSGYVVLGLVIWRLTWGIVGGHYARFSSFVRGPRAVVRALRELFARDGPPSPGHNPLGALSVLALLLALAVQAGTGLFANDDIMLEGPLTHLVEYETSRDLTGIHHRNKWIIGALVSLHLVAIAFHEIWKRDRLVVPMITGVKRLPVVPPARAGWLATVLSIAGAAGGVYYLVTEV